MKKALIVVDVQPTFCEGGSLPVAGGNATAQAVASFIANHQNDYDLLVSTQDWHIDPGPHFSETPDFVDTWPPHGVADSMEAKLHPALAHTHFDVSVKKGQYQAAYSGFEGSDESGMTLADILTQARIKQVDIVGIAQSHCVLETALDAVKQGLEVCVFTDLTVPVSPELGELASQKMLAAGIKLQPSDSI